MQIGVLRINDLNSKYMRFGEASQLMIRVTRVPHVHNMVTRPLNTVDDERYGTVIKYLKSRGVRARRFALLCTADHHYNTHAWYAVDAGTLFFPAAGSTMKIRLKRF